MSLVTARVITSHQIEATWTLPTKLQTRVSKFNEAIPLATLIITILILLYHGINRHCFCTNEQSYDKLLTVHIIPLNR